MPDRHGRYRLVSDGDGFRFAKPSDEAAYWADRAENPGKYEEAARRAGLAEQTGAEDSSECSEELEDDPVF